MKSTDSKVDLVNITLSLAKAYTIPKTNYRHFKMSNLVSNVYIGILVPNT